MTALLLRYDEAAYLAAYLRRQVAWDSRAAVRLQVRGSTLGVYAAPPVDCTTLVALPLDESQQHLDGLDELVGAGRLRDIIGDVSANSPREPRRVTLPDSVGPVAELAVLPPRGPWLPAERGVAGDVRPLVTAAVDDFKRRVQALGSTSQATRESLAYEVWSRPGWGGVPVRALHVASMLGFMPHDGLRIETATCEGFKRLMTPGGQVFVRTTGLPARLSLAVVS